MNLTDSIICCVILRPFLNSAYILWQLSAPSVYSVLWSVHSVISTSRVAFQSVWYRLCLHSRWCVRMCNICLEIHFIDVCIWFYCLCNRCKWWIWFEVVTFKHVCGLCVFVMEVCVWVNNLVLYLYRAFWCHLLSGLGTFDGYQCYRYLIPAINLVDFEHRVLGWCVGWWGVMPKVTRKMCRGNNSGKTGP